MAVEKEVENVIKYNENERFSFAEQFPILLRELENEL